MKTQFMLIALAAVAVMAIPGAFADVEKYDIDLVIGQADAERFLEGTLTRTLVDDSVDEWSGNFTIDGKDPQTYTITIAKFVFDNDGNHVQLHIKGESETKRDRTIIMNITQNGYKFTVTGGEIKVANDHGSENVQPVKTIPIKSGIVSEVLKQPFTKTQPIQ